MAHRELVGSVAHRRSRYLLNRAEISHRPTRQRGRAMKRCTSPGRAHRFLSAFSGIWTYFRSGRHLLSGAGYRPVMAGRLVVWTAITGAATAVA